MKKILTSAICVALLAITALPASAQQQGDMAWGAKLAFGSTDGYSNLGLGAKIQYNVTDPIRLEASFSYFLPKKESIFGLPDIKTSAWDFSVNAHWLFPVENGLTLYPLAGLGILGTKAKSDDLVMGDTVIGATNRSGSDLGLNLGGGVDYALSENMFLNAEVKYMVAGNGFFEISAGVGFNF